MDYLIRFRRRLDPDVINGAWSSAENLAETKAQLERNDFVIISVKQSRRYRLTL